MYIYIYKICMLYIIDIERDKRETKKNYEFSVTLSFMFNQFSNCFNKTILSQECNIQLIL